MRHHADSEGRPDQPDTVRQGHYSVPARFIGERVRVLLRGNEPLVFERRNIVARHPRLTERYGYRAVLDHYLEILLVEPGAMAGSTALAAARAEGLLLHRHPRVVRAAADGEDHCRVVFLGALR
ncbi:Mu transposase domain-containing protein [Streptomyces olivaceoviridis]|uniref:Mu transposase domain-containing protein n=1 Tax=Streptomyces olivaceoviridis TaxID=1921 RepID=UPI0036C01D12